MATQQSFADRVRAFRATHGLTQQTLHARYPWMLLRTINNWEQGVSEPTPMAAVRSGHGGPWLFLLVKGLFAGDPTKSQYTIFHTISQYQISHLTHF